MIIKIFLESYIFAENFFFFINLLKFTMYDD